VQRIGKALRRALVQPGARGEFRQRQPGVRFVEGAQQPQPLGQGADVKRVSSSVVIIFAASWPEASALTLDAWPNAFFNGSHDKSSYYYIIRGDNLRNCQLRRLRA
jgi:hypothetical protein